MDVSVIVPTYNRAGLLTNCVYSLLNQTFEGNYEIIIVDNNSNDNTFEEYKLKFGDNPVVRYEKERRKGLVFSRHLGMKSAAGEILIFVDDDGEYNNSCIQAIVDVYKSNRDVAAVGGKIEIKWDKNPPKWIYQYEYVLGKLDYGSDIIYSHRIYINGGLFSIKKDILLHVNGFNPDQVGDYLIGDGEAGLCRKLHKNGFLIAWTPHAIMKHIQFTEKNATRKDIGRRFYNDGISTSYGLFSKYDFKLNAITIFNLFRKTLFLFIIFPFSFFIRRVRFLKDFTKGEIYFYILFLNKEYRDKLKTNNWF
jgi:glycosyltransferase involved in cell wall biosynthesis